MFSTYDSTVNSLYLAFYGRPADPSGLKFWSQALVANNGDASTIIGAFATSQEAQTRFGSDDAGARITAIYEQLFNRAPDAAGLAYWTSAVESGNATLAEVSVAILKGAQGSDLDLSTLRQKAADAFTAAVEDGSTEYSGYASIEAARVLVRAVTTDATDADLAKLVKAAVSFADTATKTPKVVEAIATGSTLLNLYDSARGLKDPVALTQALADTAKAAAGDPVTLESLLRGGGMDKVLKVMPAKATLTDVVEALAKGGLPAAVEVVYPTAPATTPAPSTPMKLKYDSVSQGEFDTDKTDNITNVKQATVKFSYTGSDLKAGQKFEFSTDGVNWSSDKIKVDAVGNVVTVSDVLLSGKESSHITRELDSTVQVIEVPMANVKTQVYLRAVDAAKEVFAKASEQVEYDGVAPTEHVVFLGVNPGDSSSNVYRPSATFQLSGGFGDGIVQWRATETSAWTVVNALSEDNTFALTGIDLSKSVQVRVIDAAGNVGQSFTQNFDTPVDPLPPAPKFMVMPSEKGLVFASGAAGSLQIVEEGKAFDLANTLDVTLPNARLAGAQEHVRSGQVQFKLTDGPVLTDSQLADTIVTLGTNGGDETLSGQYVWGFDGNDIINGTAGNDILIGGAGNDRINGGAGSDMIQGGSGGDVIDLGVDQAHDRVFYAAGEAATPDFVNAGSTLGIDKILNFGVDDAIQLDIDFGNAQVNVQSTYLGANGNPMTVALVRGHDVEGAFSAGSTSNDTDYMLQWMEDGAVNSVILKDQGTKAPTLEISGKSIFHAPDPIAIASYYTGAKPNLASNPGLIDIMGSQGFVNGVADAASFSLTDVSTGMEAMVPEFEESLGELTTHGGSALHLKTALAASVFKMSWTDDTFTTTNGYLQAGEAYFAGGTGRDFDHRGFALNEQPLIVSGNAFASNGMPVNDGFIASGPNATIHTGGGSDVVVAGSGTATLVYDALDNTAQDLVLGFGRDDTVLLDGVLAAYIDRDGKDGINWAEGRTIDADTEAVQVVLPGHFSFGKDADMTNVLAALNNQLVVTNVGINQHLLILAQGAHETDSVLFVFQNQDGDRISASELTTIATFSAGVLTTAEIDVVGSNLGAELGGNPP